MTLELSDDEALVLFDLLADYATKDDGRNLPIRHASERNALWTLEASLERQLTAPFQSDYGAQLEAARLHLEEMNGGW
jgi:hypothetical protein